MAKLQPVGYMVRATLTKDTTSASQSIWITFNLIQTAVKTDLIHFFNYYEAIIMQSKLI